MYMRARTGCSTARMKLSPQGIRFSTSATNKAITYGMLTTKK